MSTASRSPITTHVLDLQRGVAAGNIDVRLEKSEGEKWLPVAQGTTNSDGRIETLLAPGSLKLGIYRLNFATQDYFRKLSLNSFYPLISITFEVTDERAHHHVPLLLSPFGYSTYKGT